MMDFTSKLLYDQGIYDPIDAPAPVFSKPIWKALVHETGSADDRIRILNAKAFNASSNPNILPGIYTRPDVWIASDDDWTPEGDRSIHFITRQCRFAHNAANRPIEALLGHGSLWWNKMWCNAVLDLGFHVEPISSVDELETWAQRSDTLEAAKHVMDFDDGRRPFIRAMMQNLLEAGVDVLGQGGEFIILNQAVIDWDRTREVSGFETAHKRRFKAVAANMEKACAKVRDVILELRQTTPYAMVQIRPIPSLNTLVMTSVMMDRETFERALPKLEEIASEHKLKLALEHDAFQSHGLNSAQFGYVTRRGKYFFRT